MLAECAATKLKLPGSRELTNIKDKSWIAVPLFSAALLIPCFWQSRIQAADLSSHIYNAWLASRIRQGAAPGLWISSQSNNILFDLMLEWLLGRVGPDLAQKIAVAISVLIFGWGAVLFVFRFQKGFAVRSSASASPKKWWIAAPCVAMLSYGFIFHMGFFNFFLSMGLCLWSLAIYGDTDEKFTFASWLYPSSSWLGRLIPFPSCGRWGPRLTSRLPVELLDIDVFSFSLQEWPLFSPRGIFSPIATRIPGLRGNCFSSQEQIS